jgi:hypothetical protein
MTKFCEMFLNILTAALYVQFDLIQLLITNASTVFHFLLSKLFISLISHGFYEVMLILRVNFYCFFQEVCPLLQIHFDSFHCHT